MAAIAAKARGGTTVIDRLYQEGCAKIRLPRTHGPSLQAVLINSSGGLTDGDEVAWSAEAGPGTHMVVTTQSCERIYRAAGDSPAAVRNTVRIGAGARLDWLPQETILFEGARLVRNLAVEMAPDSTFFGLEAVILGRHAMGEDALGAALTDRWRVRRGGELVHAEETRLGAGDRATRASGALLAGAGAFGTLCYVAADAERRHCALLDIMAGLSDCGVSRIGNKLVVRALAASGLGLRRVLLPVIAALVPGNGAPRLWTT